MSCHLWTPSYFPFPGLTPILPLQEAFTTVYDADLRDFEQDLPQQWAR
jgi:hypothetical protein